MGKKQDKEDPKQRLRKLKCFEKNVLEDSTLRLQAATARADDADITTISVAQYAARMDSDLAEGRIADALFDHCLYLNGLAKVLLDLVADKEGGILNGPIEVEAESVWVIGRLLEEEVEKIEAKSERAQDLFGSLQRPVESDAVAPPADKAVA